MVATIITTMLTTMTTVLTTITSTLTAKTAIIMMTTKLTNDCNRYSWLLKKTVSDKQTTMP